MPPSPPPPSPAVVGDLGCYGSTGGSLPGNGAHLPGLDGGQEEGGSCGSSRRRQPKVQHRASYDTYVPLVGMKKWARWKI